MGRKILGLFLAVASYFFLANAVSAPLFDYESEQFTTADLKDLSQSEQQLFGFDSSSKARAATPKCKVFPGDSDWPSNLKWKALNVLTLGALIKTTPLAASCYNEWGYNAAECAEVKSKFTDTYFHEADPTSNMFPFFQGRTCMPTDDPNGNCTLGSYPSYVVNVSTVAQIQLSVNFARNNNLRLVIKNTGHDYLGKSLGAGALGIWTHHLRNIQFIKDYQSDSGYKGPVFKVGAGVTVREVYEAADKQNVMVAGGLCESVGFAGGYIQGGGHTPLSGYYGIGADSVEAFQVVTADGRFVTASATKNADLFWALRGGGGSTFGVVTSVVVRAHPNMPVTTTTLLFGTGMPGSNETISPETFFKGVRGFFKRFDAWANAHLYAYFFLFPIGPDSYLFQLAPTWGLNHTEKSLNALMQPWFAELRELGIAFQPNTTHYDDFFSAYTGTWPLGSTVQTAGDTASIPGNRIMPDTNWKDDAKFNRMMAAVENNMRKGYFFIGYQQAPKNRLNVDNAVSSAFRHARSMLIVASIVEGGAAATKESLQKASSVLTNDILGPLREAAPVEDFGGSYSNEANVVEAQFQENFYGLQYPKLLQIKKKRDPRSVFYAATAVGSEEWEVHDGDWGTQTQNGRLCRVS